jgi:hypothetical protein
VRRFPCELSSWCRKASGVLELKNSLFQWGNHFFYSINQTCPAIISLKAIVTLV